MSHSLSLGILITITAILIIAPIIAYFRHESLYCSLIPQAKAQPECDYYPQQHYYNGILQLYQHKPGGNIWSLEGNWSNNRPINSGGDVISVGGGWYQNTGNLDNIRNEVYTPNYLQHKHHLDTFDQSVWRQQGYMDSPQDWKNVEVSGIFYPCADCQGAGQGPANIVDMVIRGAENENGMPWECAATNYHAGYSPTGADQSSKLERDIDHTAGYNAGQITGDKLTTTPIPQVGLSHPFAFKIVLYNNQANTAVRIDAYLDTTGAGNQWKLIWSYIDDGNKPDIDSTRGPVKCQGEDPSLPMTWGGPAVGFRFNASHMDWRQGTIQEIIPPRW